MPTADGRVATPRARRYLFQLCRHARRMPSHPAHGGRPHHAAGAPAIHHVEWTDTEGLLRLDSGVCSLHANPDALLLHVEAVDDPALRRIRHLLTTRLEGFGRRDGLQVEWQHPPDTSPDTPPDADDTTTPAAPVTDVPGALPASEVTGDAPVTRAPRWRTPTAAAVLVVALAVAVHLGLLGGLLAAPHRATGAVALVAALLAGKVLVVVLIGRRRRHTHRWRPAGAAGTPAGTGTARRRTSG